MTTNDPTARVQRLYDELVTRNRDIAHLEAAHEGHGRLTFATAEWKKENAERFAEFSDNWCEPVVSAEAERLQINGVEVRDGDGKGSRTDSTAAWLWNQWETNDIEAGSAQGITTTLVAKRSHILVWDDGMNEGNPMATWEHPGNVIVQKDPANRNNVLRALKTWQDDDKIYATLYEKDWIYKYEKPRNQTSLHLPESVKLEMDWAARSMSGVEPNVIPNPLGVVPVVEIPNRPNLRGVPRSELTNVIPLQDAVNVLWAYLMSAADYASMPARVLLNSTPPMRAILDENGKKIAEKPVTMQELNQARMAVFHATGADKDARIDQWDPAQLSPFTDVIEIAVAHIAAQTRTPPHYLVSTKGLSNLAADALKAAETGLVKKAQDCARYITPEIRRANVLMAMVNGDRRMIEAAKRSRPTWENPEMRSDAQLADAQTKKRSIGMPMRYILEMEGLPPHRIDEVLEQIKDEKRADMRLARELGMQGMVDSGYYDGDIGEPVADALEAAGVGNAAGPEQGLPA